MQVVAIVNTQWMEDSSERQRLKKVLKEGRSQPRRCMGKSKPNSGDSKCKGVKDGRTPLLMKDRAGTRVAGGRGRGKRAQTIPNLRLLLPMRWEAIREAGQRRGISYQCCHGMWGHAGCWGGSSLWRGQGREAGSPVRVLMGVLDQLPGCRWWAASGVWRYFGRRADRICWWMWCGCGTERGDEALGSWKVWKVVIYGEGDLLRNRAFFLWGDSFWPWKGLEYEDLGVSMLNLRCLLHI